MQSVTHSSTQQPITAPGYTARHLMAIGMVGAAMVDYQVCKTEAARQHLQQLTIDAVYSGELGELDAEVVARVLASVPQHRPLKRRLTQSPTCDVCGRNRGAADHTRCSRIRQQQFEQQQQERI